MTHPRRFRMARATIVTVSSFSLACGGGDMTEPPSAVAVALDASTVSLFRQETRRFTATVSGTTQTGVTWAATCGTVAAAGLAADYTAPDAPGTCTVTATSTEDVTKSASAAVTVEPDWVVTALDDEDDGACTRTHCSFREALDAAQGEAGASIIRLTQPAAAPPAGIGTANLNGVLTLTSALPDITTPLEIIGPGAAQLTIHAGGTAQTPRRIFTVTGGVAVSIRGLTLTGGKAASGGAVAVSGGAELDLADMVLTGNEALTEGGGALEAFDGTVTLTGTTVTNNTSTSRGGGLFLQGAADVTLTDVMLTNNIAQGGTATGFGGGGIYLHNTATVRMTNSVLSGNQAQGTAPTREGGAIYAVGATTVLMTGGAIRGNSATGGGGAIFAAGNTVTLEGVDVEDNQAGLAGAGLAVWNGATLTVTGGKVADNTITGNAVGAGISSSASTVALEGVAITGNTTPSSGGAMHLFGETTATMNGVTITGNTALFGGGISKAGPSVVTVTNSVVSENTATNQGGGMQLVGAGSVTLDRVTVAGNTATGSGGGVTAGLTVTITNSTVSGNSSGGTGGGVFATSTGNVTVRNTTLSGNSAAIGGGLGVTGAATIQNVSFVGNIATTFGGGIGSNNAGAPMLTNVLLSANLLNDAADNCAVGGGAGIGSAGHNLSDDGTCAAFLTQGTDISNGDAGVNATLADNGGPTFTHALLDGSEAINGADAAVCPPADQRGFGRQGACDIGAFEFGGTAPAPSALRVGAVRASGAVKTRPSGHTGVAPSANLLSGLDPAASPARPDQQD